MTPSPAATRMTVLQPPLHPGLHRRAEHCSNSTWSSELGRMPYLKRCGGMTSPSLETLPDEGPSRLEELSLFGPGTS